MRFGSPRLVSGVNPEIASHRQCFGVAPNGVANCKHRTEVGIAMLPLVGFPYFGFCILMLLGLGVVFCPKNMTPRRSSSRAIALTINVLTTLPLLALFMLIIRGGAPTTQLSGNMSAWSTWGDLWPMLAILSIDCVVAAFLSLFAFLVLQLHNKTLAANGSQLLHQLFTFGYSLLAAGITLSNFPDA